MQHATSGEAKGLAKPGFHAPSRLSASEGFATLLQMRPDLAETLRSLVDVLGSEAGHTRPSAAALGQLRSVAGKLTAAAENTPYFDLDGYMRRNWLVTPESALEARMPCCARMHTLLRSDDDRALHDHPWDNVSVVLGGGYWELVPGALTNALEDRAAQEKGIDAKEAAQRLEIAGHADGDELDEMTTTLLADSGLHWRGPGSVVSRRATDLHRLILPGSRPATSLFFMGGKSREWGFQWAGQWTLWSEYLNLNG